MHSRARLLLEREFREFKENNFEGITAFPVSEDKMKWEAEIEGLQNSFWHGLVLHLTINFTSEYNYAPPVVKFKTIPFHPNVSPHTGQPCIDFLDNPRKWSTSHTLSSILLALQVMLSNPVLENPVNLEAAQILMKDESMYRTIILKLFNKPLQLKEKSSVLKLPEDSHKCIGPIKAVSFSDYYKTWSVIATSKATEYYRAPLLEDPNFTGQYHQWKKMDLRCPKEWNLKFAAIKSGFARKNRMPHKVSHSREKIRLCPTPDNISPEPQIEINIATEISKTEGGWKSKDPFHGSDWEEEVEDLVAWTSSLNMDTLED
ncbi:ubiquitin-conjugating enzyme E2 U isoform X1 [Nycticebus coucang]|uniref:ubiquitin-conjugating enzyme E2 U isoform X1 n=1 Tax=Nycticebus coucang TaxID=9470 RepID=UPI00234E1860|nr:ubiquitin-conjugating enzyme E2 U isoform X1 [Nycticebus coucang]